jgi:arylsulfatase
MVEYQDYTIGRVLDYLREHGQLENTVVIYTVDNGAEAFDTLGPLSNEIQMRFVRENFDLSIEAMGTAESFITYGSAWAGASATPLSWHKGYVSEGGTRVPFIVNEPGSKSTDKLHTRLTHIKDIAATILDVAGVDPNPPGPDGKRFPMMEGRSVMGVVRGETQLVRPENEPIGWEMFGNAVLAMGDWKLQRIRPGMRGSGKWELYNLTEDPGETTDLSSVEAAQFRLMRDLYETYALKSNVRPIDDDWNPYASIGLEE